MSPLLSFLKMLLNSFTPIIEWMLAALTKVRNSVLLRALEHTKLADRHSLNNTPSRQCDHHASELEQIALQFESDLDLVHAGIQLRRL